MTVNIEYKYLIKNNKVSEIKPNLSFRVRVKLSGRMVQIEL